MRKEEERILEAQKKEDVFIQVVEENMGLVHTIAHRYHSPYLDYEDLVSLGKIGLIKAIQKFDATFDANFSTYAIPLIMGEMKRYFREEGMMKISRKYYKIQKEVEKKMEECPTWSIDEIASFLSIPPEDVILALEGKKMPVSMESKIDEDLTLGDSLGEEEDDYKLKMDLGDALQELDEKSKMLIYLRYHKDFTQKEVAERLHMTQVGVSRLEKKILESLKIRLTK